MTGLSALPVAAGRLPLLGHLVGLWRDPLGFLRALRPVGDIVRVDLGPYPVYVVTSAELQRQLLTTHAGGLVRGRVYQRARVIFGNGLATSDGPWHRRQRRLVQPAFQRARIEQYTQAMVECARRGAESWQHGQLLQLDQAMHELTLTTLLRALFSTQIDQDTTAQVCRLMPVVLRNIPIRMVTPGALDRLPFLTGARRFDTAVRQLRALVDQLATERVNAHGSDSSDLLDLLLTQPMTRAELGDELVSLLVAGVETTGTTLAWTFHQLARHPAVERRVHQEIDQLIGTGPVTTETLAGLEYTRRVLWEVLRLHPPLLFTRRSTTEVQLGGVTLPPGTEVVYSPYALHRDPDRYPDPDRFEPDRCPVGSDQRAGQRDPGGLSPFGHGAHRCLGDGFAVAELTVALVTIAARWRLRPADPGRVVRTVPAAVPYPDALPMVALRRRPTDCQDET